MEPNNLSPERIQFTFDELYQLRINNLFDKFSSDNIKTLFNKAYAFVIDPKNPHLTKFEKESLFILINELRRLMPLLEATSY